MVNAVCLDFFYYYCGHFRRSFFALNCAVWIMQTPQNIANNEQVNCINFDAFVIRKLPQVIKAIVVKNLLKELISKTSSCASPKVEALDVN